jgi:anti-sigma factor RsiW
MTCKAVQSKISAYVDGELTGFEMMELRSHFGRCESCAQDVEALKDVKRLLHALPEPEPAPDFEQRLFRAVLVGRPAPATHRRFGFGWVAGFAFALTFVVSLLWLQTTVGPAMAEAPTETAVASAAEFEIVRDQAYHQGADPFSGGSIILTSGAPSNGRP